MSRQQLEEAKQRNQALLNEIAKLKRENELLSSPDHFKKKQIENFQFFLSRSKNLNFKSAIERPSGEDEVHIGVIGPIACGKSSLINTLFGLELSVGLNRTTSHPQLVFPPADQPHLINKHFIWDCPGNEDEWSFYDPKQLNFFHSLDCILICFETDIDDPQVQEMVETVYAIHPKGLILIRTKMDNWNENHQKDELEVLNLDRKKVKELCGGAEVPVLGVSSKNIYQQKEPRYHWDNLVMILQRLGRNPPIANLLQVTSNDFLNIDYRTQVLAKGIMYTVPKGISWESKYRWTHESDTIQQCLNSRCRLVDLNLKTTIKIRDDFENKFQEIQLPVIYCSRCLVLRIPGIKICGKPCNCAKGKKRLCCYQEENHLNEHGCTYCFKGYGDLPIKGKLNQKEGLLQAMKDFQVTQGKPNVLPREVEQEEEALFEPLFQIEDSETKKKFFFEMGKKFCCGGWVQDVIIQSHTALSFHNQLFVEDKLIQKNKEKIEISQLVDIQSDFRHLLKNNTLTFNHQNPNPDIHNNENNNKTDKKNENNVVNQDSPNFEKLIILNGEHPCPRGEHIGLLIGDAEFLFLSQEEKQVALIDNLPKQQEKGLFYSSPIVFCKRCGLASRLLGDSKGDLNQWLGGQRHPTQGVPPEKMNQLFLSKEQLHASDHKLILN